MRSMHSERNHNGVICISRMVSYYISVKLGCKHAKVPSVSKVTQVMIPK